VDYLLDVGVPAVEVFPVKQRDNAFFEKRRFGFGQRVLVGKDAKSCAQVFKCSWLND
jgi:hypothetical protein